MTVRLVALVAVAAAALGLGPARADAAAPRIVIVSGKPLTRPVAIANWQHIFVVVGEIAPARAVPRRRLRGRPHLELALFWGPRWDEYLRAGGSPRALRPHQADQFGHFYPAWRRRPALIDLPWAGSWPRPVSARALAVLKRYGVPIRID